MRNMSCNIAHMDMCVNMWWCGVWCFDCSYRSSLDQEQSKDAKECGHHTTCQGPSDPVRVV